MRTSWRIVLFLFLLLTALPLLADEATFDRTLKVSGPLELEVTTSSGHITVRSGPAGTITVHGIVREECCNVFGGTEPGALKAIAGDPPIEQSGNFVRIGHLGESRRYHNISVSYELVVPADTKLLSKTGSGGQEISGVAGPAEVSSGSGGLRLSDIAGTVRARTGSGSITMENLQGSVSAHTGSGSIRGERVGTGTSVESRARYEGKDLPLARDKSGDSFATANPASGDFNFETGSGTIRVSSLRGAVRAHTGSGHIELDGEATGDWSLSTGSGGITVRLPPQAAFNLSAYTSSGSIHTGRQVLVQGSTSRHELRGTVNGGGVRLDLKTSSGGIHID